jgi:uroporphyrinogen decarboxylase
MGSVSLPRDRVLKALAHQESDICPYYVWIDPQMAGPLASWYGVSDVKDIIVVDHQVMYDFSARPRPLSDDSFVDEFGAVWRQGAELHVERPALSEPSLNGYTFPDLTTDAHFVGLQGWLESHRHRFKIVQLGMLFWERTWAMRGMAQIMMDLHDHPLFVDALLDNLESICSSVISRLARDFGDRIDAIGFSDDYGAQNAMLVSPAHWRRYFKPHLRRMYDRIHSAGKFVYLHSCGHIEPIVGELIELGVDMLQPIQPESMDIFALKRQYGSRLCFAGGISTQWTLPFGTPEQVRDATRRCLETMGEGGGYVAAPAKPILPGVPLANAVALLDTLGNQQPR